MHLIQPYLPSPLLKCPAWMLNIQQCTWLHTLYANIIPQAQCLHYVSDKTQYILINYQIPSVHVYGENK